MPCRLRSRIAASLKPGFRTGCAQPERMATRPRFAPSALNEPGPSKAERAGTRRGARSIMARSRAPNSGRAASTS